MGLRSRQGEDEDCDHEADAAVVVCLGVLLPLERRFTAALAIAGAVTAASFLWHFQFSEGRNLSDPIGLVHFVAIYLGSAPTPSSGTAAIAGAAGLVLFSLLCRLFWIGRSRGLFVGFLPAVRARLHPVAIGVPAYLAGAAMVALVLGLMSNAPSERGAAVAGKAATVVAYRAGVEDPSNEQYVRGACDERLSLGATGAARPVVARRIGRRNARHRRRQQNGSRLTRRARPGGAGHGRDSAWRLDRDAGRRGELAEPGRAGGRRSPSQPRLVGLHRPGLEQPGVADAEWRGFVALCAREADLAALGRTAH